MNIKDLMKDPLKGIDTLNEVYELYRAGLTGRQRKDTADNMYGVPYNTYGQKMNMGFADSDIRKVEGGIMQIFRSRKDKKGYACFWRDGTLLAVSRSGGEFWWTRKDIFMQPYQVKLLKREQIWQMREPVDDVTLNHYCPKDLK